MCGVGNSTIRGNLLRLRRGLETRTSQGLSSVARGALARRVPSFGLKSVACEGEGGGQHLAPKIATTASAESMYMLRSSGIYYHYSELVYS